MRFVAGRFNPVDGGARLNVDTGTRRSQGSEDRASHFTFLMPHGAASPPGF
jgi:hypothetical protein